MELFKSDEGSILNDILKRIENNDARKFSNTEEDRCQNRNEFTSCISYWKRPILPPLLSSLDRSEMAYYRELAVNLEKRKRLHSNSNQIQTTAGYLNDEECDRTNDSLVDDAVSVIQHQSNVEMNCSSPTSFASTDLAKYMNSTCEEYHSNSSCDESTDVQVSVIPNAINEETIIDEEIEEGMESTSTTPRVRKLSYTLDQPSPALMTYLKNLNINSEIHATGPLTQVEDESLNQNASLDHELPKQVPSYSSIFETFEPKSIFKNLFLKLQAEMGLDETIMQQKDLENLVKEHDEALQNLTNNFLKTISNLLSNSKQVPVSVPAKIVVKNNYSILSTPPDANTSGNVKNADDSEFSISQFKRAQVTSKFDRVSAAVKGYLTRRLLRTQKVQAIVKTIKDTLEFAFELHSDSPITDGCVTPQDAELHERLLSQLSSACFEIHDIFFKTTIKERMDFIAQDRVILKEKFYKEVNTFSTNKTDSGERNKHRKLSSATIKTMDRRRRRTIDSRNSISPRSWGITKLKSPRESPIKGPFSKNVASEIRRSLTSSPVSSVSSYQYIEQRSLSSLSENSSSLPLVRRSLNFAKKPVVRKINIKLNSAV